ncbi:MAG: hypothetical protein GY777_27105 [Candidatus Brocadiaceae bacterium]|nr:hypothetical protein [Candidatus Brocadiaceae bacterium]
MKDLSNLRIPNDEPSATDSLGRETLLLGVSRVLLQAEPPMVIGELEKLHL